MTSNEPVGPQRPSLQRSQQNRILGGVCAAIADHLGIDPVLVRIIAVLLGIISGGAAVIAYLVAWVLIPSAGDAPAPRPARPAASAGQDGAREAWKAVGEELRGLAAGLRTSGPATSAGPAGAAPDTSTGQGARRPVEAGDAAMTAFGDRLRDPEVQAGARRAADGLSAAVSASFDELGRRTRRTEQPPTQGAPGSDEQPPDPGAPRSGEQTDGKG
jgi:phage shock protein PspC (stress-responsive transcriptional regulator)